MIIVIVVLGQQKMIEELSKKIRGLEGVIEDEIGVDKNIIEKEEKEAKIVIWKRSVDMPVPCCQFWFLPWQTSVNPQDGLLLTVFWVFGRLMADQIDRPRYTMADLADLLVHNRIGVI